MPIDQGIGYNPPMRAAAAIGTLVLLLASSTANAETIAGRASVIDGDTLEIHGERIRILDIDAPESRQSCVRDDAPIGHAGSRQPYN